MPVTITPAPGTRVGPYIPVTVSTDVVGPFPSDEQWESFVYTDSDFTDLMWQETHAYHGFAPDFWLWFKEPTNFTQSLVSQFPANGDNVYVRVNLVRGSTGDIDDTGTVTAHWDGTAGLGFQIADQIGAVGGFTAEDRTTVNASLSAVSVSLPALGGVGGAVVRTLADLVAGVPPRYTSRHGSILISGQGSLGVGSEPFRFDSVGMEWHWNIVPARFGAQLGSLDEYFNRMVQFRLIMQDLSGQPFQGPVIDSNAEGERYTWAAQQPTTVEWYVVPGVVVELAFLVMVLG